VDYDQLLIALAGVWGAGAGAVVARVGRRGVGTALLVVLVCVALAAATGTRPELAVWLLLAPATVLSVGVTGLALPLAGAALALLGLVTFVPEHAGHWTTALLGALALGAGYFGLSRIDSGGSGDGDGGGLGLGEVKLAVGAGVVLGWYGWPTVMLGAFAGFLLRAIYGAFAARRRRDGRGIVVPFGPFLLAGAFLGLLVGAYTA
jgi:leader peptidase (prepilin peptidase)/N-methyltransferase